MDMRDYALFVIPVVLLFYGTCVLFLHPPMNVVRASLLAGSAMALLNIAGDEIAIHTSEWSYHASGLIGQLPLPLYTTSLFISGGLAYLFIWRFWRGAYHWLAILLLVGVPVLGYMRDLWQSHLVASILVWNGQLAWAGDLLLWLVMFFCGYALFRSLTPVRQDAGLLPTRGAEHATLQERQK